jgi:hypothetical protein
MPHQCRISRTNAAPRFSPAHALDTALQVVSVQFEVLHRLFDALVPDRCACVTNVRRAMWVLNTCHNTLTRSSFSVPRIRTTRTGRVSPAKRATRLSVRRV